MLTLFHSILGTEGTPDSINPSVLDEEEGLPSPPLDEGAFFATEPTSMELSRVMSFLLLLSQWGLQMLLSVYCRLT